METFLFSIIECAKKVYETLGTGHSEIVYHKAMEVELRHQNIRYESKVILPILYRGLTVGHGEADLVVYDVNVDDTVANPGVVVELKAVAYEPREQERAQIIGYLRSRGWPNATGLIINFRQPSSAKSIQIVDWQQVTNTYQHFPDEDKDDGAGDCHS